MAQGIMNCANCTLREGIVYTSMPPKIRCPFTGEFHYYMWRCDVDFEPVIRCKECTYWGTRVQDNYNNTGDCLNFFGHMTRPDFYCKFGERKENE